MNSESPRPRAIPRRRMMMEKAKTEKTETDKKPQPPKMPKEIGGPTGPEPTRYGDWEKNGRCTDF